MIKPRNMRTIKDEFRIISYIESVYKEADKLVTDENHRLLIESIRGIAINAIGSTQELWTGIDYRYSMSLKDNMNLVTNVEETFKDPGIAIMEIKEVIEFVYNLLEDMKRVTGDYSIRTVVNGDGYETTAVLADSVFKSDAFWCFFYEHYQICKMQYLSLERYFESKKKIA